MELASPGQKQVIAIIVEVLIPIVCVLVVYTAIKDRISFPAMTVAKLRSSTPVDGMEAAKDVYGKDWVKHINDSRSYYRNEYAFTWGEKEYEFSTSTDGWQTDPETVRFNDINPEQREVGRRPPLWLPLFMLLGYIYYFADRRTRFRVSRWANGS